MRKSRVNLPNRCYHLISRVAHRAFFLDDGERTRLVDLVRRGSRFSGVKLLAYGVMSNHFHVFVYIGHPGNGGQALMTIAKLGRAVAPRPPRSARGADPTRGTDPRARYQLF